jgi:RNA polymerase sigma factor (TIGR02999 family)
MSTPHEPPAAAPDAPDITQLLLSWSGGDKSSGDALMAAVYDELHRQASRAMGREQPGHTLQATALVSEAYLRLVDQRRVQWKNRAHFFGIAAQLMRRILVDHVRARLAEKRGGATQLLTLEDVASVQDSPEDNGVDVLALHDALQRLAAFDPDQARIVELRYFGGLTIQDTAEALGSSPATVKREWAIARAWLRRELATSS